MAAEQECKNPSATEQIIYCDQQEVDATNIEVLSLVAQHVKDFKENDELLKKDNLPLATEIFKGSQMFWTEYRDNACKADYIYTGNGELRRIDYLDCLIKFNKSRIRDLSERKSDSSYQ